MGHTAPPRPFSMRWARRLPGSDVSSPQRNPSHEDVARRHHQRSRQLRDLYTAPLHPQLVNRRPPRRAGTQAQGHRHRRSGRHPCQRAPHRTLPHKTTPWLCYLGSRCDLLLPIHYCRRRRLLGKVCAPPERYRSGQVMANFKREVYIARRQGCKVVWNRRRRYQASCHAGTVARPRERKRKEEVSDGTTQKIDKK
jgi:hypothetical protein